MCSVNLGIFSTSGDVQYMGGYHEYIGHVQYIRGYHYECGEIPCVHRRNTIVHQGEYHEYIGGCSVHQRDIMMHVGEQHDKSFPFLLKTLMYS